MANYLLDNPSGYYFRYSIPVSLRPLVGKREIKYPLHTTYRRDAKYQAAYLGDSLKKLFRPLIHDSNRSITEDTPRLLKSSINALLAQTKTSEQGSRVGLSSSFTLEKSHPSMENLSSAINKYCAEKQKSGTWAAKSAAQNIASLTQLLEVVSDIPIQAINSSHARTWKDTLLCLPPNVGKKPMFKNLSTTQAAKCNRGSTISITTFNNIHTRVSAFFWWAHRNDYITRNYFEGLKVREPKRAREKRAAFSDSDLQSIFSTQQYIKHSYNHPHYYWIPLMGLHTGARLEELCQLYLDDISKIEEVWCLQIRDHHNDQKTKTDSSNRTIPIHNKLIELGFLEYIDALKKSGKERLFPYLSRQRDGYSQPVSKWFSRYREKIGMKDITPRKDFHSFRHTLATRLKHKGVSESITGALIGHSTADKITYGLYGKDYLIEQLKNALDSIDFTNALENVRAYS